MRRTTWLVLAVAGLMMVTSLTGANAVPKGSVKHEEKYWTWFGPRSWSAAESTNDIWIASRTGRNYLRYSAGGMICANPGVWNDPASFFNAMRQSYRSSARQEAFGLYSKTIRRARYTRVGPIRAVGENHVRQTAQFRGVRRGNVIRGEMVLDFFAVNGACGNRQQVRAAPSQGFRQVRRTLRQVQRAIFGPKDYTGISGING